MSEMEYHMGKMAKMSGFDDLSREQMYEKLCILEGFTHLTEDYEWVDVFYLNDLTEKYIVTDDGAYKLIEHKNMGESHSELIHNHDGTIDFYVAFYNGGADFSEAIEDELKQLDKE